MESARNRSGPLSRPPCSVMPQGCCVCALKASLGHGHGQGTEARALWKKKVLCESEVPQAAPSPSALMLCAAAVGLVAVGKWERCRIQLFSGEAVRYRASPALCQAFTALPLAVLWKVCPSSAVTPHFLVVIQHFLHGRNGYEHTDFGSLGHKPTASVTQAISRQFIPAVHDHSNDDPLQGGGTTVEKLVAEGQAGSTAMTGQAQLGYVINEEQD
ncbi:hypothetical protein TREES_T100001558 [Tupaia chinensis]|uniref:Uncharacterized protein n=1 Tax=Tupaia chinensis TaxID=246437 RepID=L9KPD8_TUPCH|nr:hypothetical protein TREES_T100001558 [Tupaia chinensis]